MLYVSVAVVVITTVIGFLTLSPPEPKKAAPAATAPAPAAAAPAPKKSAKAT